MNPPNEPEPVVCHMTIRQWHQQRPGSDIRTYLVSSDHTADYDDAIDLAHSIATEAGYEWDAREDMKPEAVEWLLEAAAAFRLKSEPDKRGFLEITTLVKRMREHDLTISDVASHYLA